MLLARLRNVLDSVVVNYYYQICCMSQVYLDVRTYMYESMYVCIWSFACHCTWLDPEFFSGSFNNDLAVMLVDSVSII